MGPIVFVTILLVLWFGNFEPLRPVPLLWWVGGGGGGAYFAKKIDLSVLDYTHNFYGISEKFNLHPNFQLVRSYRDGKNRGFEIP